MKIEFNLRDGEYSWSTLKATITLEGEEETIQEIKDLLKKQYEDKYKIV